MLNSEQGQRGCGHSSGPESSQCEADLGFSPVLQGCVPGEAWVFSDD